MRLLRFPGVLIILLAPLVARGVAVVENRDATPSPIVVAPAQNWDGIDGSWSSFPFQVGTPPQNVRLFVSTAVHQTSVVLPQGCVASDPSNCADVRGGEYMSNTSSTWLVNTANMSSNIYPLLMGTALGYTGKAALGEDDITLGWQGAGGPTLKNQTLAGIATKDTYLGLFGLTPRASNFTSFNDPIPSFMQNLRNESLIPSLSWGYTAGNQYRLSQVLGSLTLGGYDQSRFVSHDVTWGFNPQDLRDLTVQITSITSDSKGSETSLLPNSVPAFLDSSLPYIWLPIEACTEFEKAFDLTWDTDSELYLLTDSQHDALKTQNPSITFTLGNLTPGIAVNITLPYAAFDLTAQAPLVSNTTKYFPLKRAANSTQYTLGRTFFQEAYVIADYDRGNFSVSQCSWVANAQQSIVPIKAPSSSSPSSPSNGNGTTTNNGTSSKKSAPVGAIAGGVVGGIAAVVGAALLFFYFYVKPRRRKAEAEAEAAAASAVAVAAAHEAEEKKAPTTKAADPPSDDHPAFIKPELDTEAPRTRWEMEGGKDSPTAADKAAGAVEAPTDQTGAVEADSDQMPPVEADGQDTEIHEMPAREEVASELMGQRDVAEMAGSSRRPNPRFSWVETPVEMQPGRNQPPPRWSWATSTGGDTLVGGSSEKDPLSPDASSPQDAPSPQSATTVSPQSAVPQSAAPPQSAIISPLSAAPAQSGSSEASPRSRRKWMERVPE